MIPHAAIRSATARFKPCLLLLLLAYAGFNAAGAPQTRSTLTAQVKLVVYSECIQSWPREYPYSAAFAPPGTLVVVTEASDVGGTRGFLPAVEGMRACAAVGVVVTHVAFQTGHTGGITGRLFGRFDLAVAVFFALSGFLLWRGHAAAARGLRPVPPTGHYLRSRIVRIMPGYLVAVVVILSLLPEAKADLTVWLANLSLTQIYVPLTLTAGLTQMWSLSVEVAFYLALPLLALLARRRAGARPNPGHRGGGGGQLRLGADPVRRPLRRQPAELAAGLLLVVRRRDAAGRVDGHADRVAAPAGPAGAC